MRIKPAFLSSFAMALVLTSSVWAQLAIDWYTIDGGGATFTTGGPYTLSGTLGQPDAGVLAGGDFELTGGFWFRIAPGDCDGDGDVDLDDHADFEACLLGPGGGLGAGCGCFDLDRDSDVDLLDFAEFQAAFTEP